MKRLGLFVPGLHKLPRSAFFSGRSHVTLTNTADLPPHDRLLFSGQFREPALPNFATGICSSQGTQRGASSPRCTSATFGRAVYVSSPHSTGTRRRWGKHQASTHGAETSATLMADVRPGHSQQPCLHQHIQGPKQVGGAAGCSCRSSASSYRKSGLSSSGSPGGSDLNAGPILGSFHATHISSQSLVRGFITPPPTSNRFMLITSLGFRIPPTA